MNHSIEKALAAYLSVRCSGDCVVYMPEAFEVTRTIRNDAGISDAKGSNVECRVEVSNKASAAGLTLALAPRMALGMQQLGKDLRELGLDVKDGHHAVIFDQSIAADIQKILNLTLAQTPGAKSNQTQGR